MNTTKEVLKYYESEGVTLHQLKQLVNDIEKSGYNRQTYATLRMVAVDLQRHIAIEFAYGAWSKE